MQCFHSRYTFNLSFSQHFSRELNVFILFCRTDTVMLYINFLFFLIQIPYSRRVSIHLFLQNCTLSFTATNSSNEGAYVVVLYMKDFANQNITLSEGPGFQIHRSTSDMLSRIPLQFVVKGAHAAKILSSYRNRPLGSRGS